MDEIQCSLRASLQANAATTARKEFFRNLPKAPDALAFWLLIAIKMSETEPWWYDTLVTLAQRYRESTECQDRRTLPAPFLNWCLGVTAGQIKRPRLRGRPPSHIRDALIRAAIEAYLSPVLGNELCSLSKACGLVGDAAGIDESVVRKIWGRSQPRQQ